MTEILRCPKEDSLLLNLMQRLSTSLFGHSFRECSPRHLGHLPFLSLRNLKAKIAYLNSNGDLVLENKKLKMIAEEATLLPPIS